MKLIDFKKIENLDIKPDQYYQWVNEVFRLKYSSVLPPKISIKSDDNVFVNTMPCQIPAIGRYGVKVVSRYPHRIPSLKSDIMLYDMKDGRLLSIMDGSMITAMRTGAIAAMTIINLQKSDTKIYGFIGLGNTARATLLCLMSQLKGDIEVVLLSYKNQAELFIERFKEYTNIHFSIVEDKEELVRKSDVIVSCVTAAEDLTARDECYKKGVLVVPIHTRGFQNCDLFFDKVVVDDIGHVREFKYFDRFNRLRELSQVLLGDEKGRENDEERIIAYNIGIAINDIYIANKVYELIDEDDTIELQGEQPKFWI